MVGQRIKYLRLKKGLSINELSDQSGVSKSYLSYIERGIQKNPSLQVLSKLANTLGTTVDDLLQTSPAKKLQLPELDEDWIQLVRDAINQGITKEDFSYYLAFIKFKKKNGEDNHGK